MPRPPARSRPPAAGADPRVAELFALPPEELTRARDALARELSARGDAAGAARVRALRRPTVATWVLNRLGRERPAEVGALLDAGEKLRQAQARALHGGAAALRAASAAHREALSALLQAAEGIARDAGRSGGATLLGAVERGLRAASAGDAPVREALRAGVLEREPEPPGLDLLAGLAAVAPPTRTSSVRAERTPSSVRAERSPSSVRAERSPSSVRAERTPSSVRAERRPAQRAGVEAPTPTQRERAETRRRADEEVAGALRAVEEAEKVLLDARRRLAEARKARGRGSRA